MRGVTGDAIGGMGEIFASLDQISLRQFFGNAGGIGALIIRQRDRASRWRTPSVRESAPARPRQPKRDDGDNGDRDADPSHCQTDLAAAFLIARRMRI